MRRPVLLACAFFPLVGAQSSAFDLQQITIHGLNPNAWPDVQATIMDAAGVVPVDVYGTGKLEELVNQTCPGAGEAYLAALPDAVSSLNPDIVSAENFSLEMEVGDEHEVSTLFLPYCLGAGAPRYTVQAGDSLWTIFQTHAADGGIADWEEFKAEVARLNGSVPGNALAPGETIVLPRPNVVVTVPDSAAETLLFELKQIEAVVDIDLHTPAWGGIKAVPPQTLSDDAECDLDTAKAAAEGHSVLWSVARAMMFNDALDDISTRWAVRTRAPVEVAVLDTGVMGRDVSPMRELLGTLGSFPPADQVTLPGHDLGQHGTGVFFATTGVHPAPLLASLLQTVRVAPHQVYSRVYCPPHSPVEECRIAVNNDRVMAALREAETGQNTIVGVNMSVSLPEDPPTFSDLVSALKKSLLVVAAGNGREDLSQQKKSPAWYGGQDATNLMTVAAVTLDRRLLASSARSPDHVDIAAWGCNVPVLEFDAEKGDFVTVYRTGTSYAAPQVLFAAALILREGRADRNRLYASEVKRRLAAASDITVPLWEKIKHGRVLNVEKAMSVHTDVIELTSGQLLKGRIKFNGETAGNVAVCNDVTVPRQDLLKIAVLPSAPPGAPSGKKILVYSKDDRTTGSMQEAWCAGLSVALSLEDPFTGVTRELAPATIRDVVLATSPYWL